MNVLEAMGLEGVGPFKKQSFRFTTGIHAIYGLNRSGGKNSSNGNAAGKSMFFSSLPEMIYEEPIVGEKEDKLREGKRVFQFVTTSGKRILVAREAKGRQEHIDIKVNGKSLSHLTATKARAYLKKVFPVTQEEYNTYGHLDARVAHPLVMGTSTERKRFFTSFFSLDKIDAERRLFLAELAKLQQVKAAFSELKATYNKSKQDLLDTEEAQELETRLSKLKTILAGLNKQSGEAAEARRLIQFVVDAKEQILQLNTALAGDITEESFAEARTSNEWEYKKVKKDLKDAEQWEQYQRDNANYTEAYTALSTETKKFVRTHGSVKKALEVAKEASGMLLRFNADIKTARSDITTLRAQLGEPLPEKVVKPEENEGDLQTLKRAYTHQLEHAEQFQEGKCETCGQVVQVKDPKVLKKRLAAVTAKLIAHSDYALYVKAKKDARQLRLELEKAKGFLESAKGKASEYVEAAGHCEVLRDMPRKPAPFAGKKLQTKVLKRMLEELSERYLLLKFFSPHLDTLIQYRELTKEQKTKAKDSESLHDRINDLQEKISKIHAKLEIHNTVKGRVADMRKRLVAMTKELKDEEPLRLLVQGFSDKHIKKKAIEAISSRLMTIVNKYAKIVFSEDYKFDFRWTTKLELRVHRRYPDRVDVSDVRKLSGAESKLFTIILVIALLSFVPEHKRLSMIILDEPTANMSAETIQQFQELLPILQRLIPTVIVITPKDEVYEGATPYTVLKKNGISTIVKGFPHQQKN